MINPGPFFGLQSRSAKAREVPIEIVYVLGNTPAPNSSSKKIVMVTEGSLAGI